VILGRRSPTRILIGASSSWAVPERSPSMELTSRIDTAASSSRNGGGGGAKLGSGVGNGLEGGVDLRGLGYLLTAAAINDKSCMGAASAVRIVCRGQAA
jgi:hypothetical protein